MKQKTPVPKAPDAAEKLFERVRALVITARQTVARGVDLVQVHTCYRIGMFMVEHEQQGRARADYGIALLDALATRLTAEFGRGFSRSSLASMRSFYLAYPGACRLSRRRLDNRCRPTHHRRHPGLSRRRLDNHKRLFA